jgi:eukaryotic-like serine/threonine-protein kinase
VAARVIAGRYRLQEKVSATLMSEVWTAVDPELDRQVIVKCLAQDADRSRFEREAQAAAGLSHANIVRLFDYGEEAGRPYIVFEYLPGGSLEERLDGAMPLSGQEVTRIAADIAEGLAHAHDRGVVHRDLKPGNVLFDAEGRAKIADFGIAQFGGAVTLTEAGTILGTAAYMSPEQAAGEAATPASDVYSFGVVLYRMLTGRLPFEAGNPAELAAMHQTARPTPVGSIRPDVPAPLADLTMSALAKRPEERPASGAALAELLTLDAPPAVTANAATRVLPRGPRRRWVSRVRAPVAAGISIALLAVIGAVAAVLLVKHDSPPTSPASPVNIPHSASSTHASTGRTTSTTPTTRPTTSTSRTTTAPSTSTPPATISTSTTIPVPSPPPITETTPTTAATTTTAP